MKKRENIIYFFPELKDKNIVRKWQVDIIFYLKEKLKCSIFIYDDWINDCSKNSKMFRKYFNDIFINGIKEVKEPFLWYEIIKKDRLLNLLCYEYCPTDYIIAFIKSDNLLKIKENNLINFQKESMLIFTSTPINLDFALRWNCDFNLNLTCMLFYIISEALMNCSKDIKNIKIRLGEGS